MMKPKDIIIREEPHPLKPDVSIYRAYELVSVKVLAPLYIEEKTPEACEKQVKAHVEVNIVHFASTKR